MPSLHSPLWFAATPPTGHVWHGYLQVIVKNAWDREMVRGDLAWISLTQPTTIGSPMNVYVPNPFTSGFATVRMAEKARLLGVVDTTKILTGATGRVVVEGPIHKLNMDDLTAPTVQQILCPSIQNPRWASIFTGGPSTHTQYMQGFAFRSNSTSWTYVLLDRVMLPD